MASVPSVRLLLTSRVPLRVEGEHVHHLLPLREDDAPLTQPASAGLGVEAAERRGVGHPGDGVGVEEFVGAGGFEIAAQSQPSMRRGDGMHPRPRRFQRRTHFVRSAAQQLQSEQ